MHHLGKAGESVLLMCWSSSIPGAAPALELPRVGATSGEQSSPLCHVIKAASLPWNDSFLSLSSLLTQFAYVFCFDVSHRAYIALSRPTATHGKTSVIVPRT